MLRRLYCPCDCGGLELEREDGTIGSLWHAETCAASRCSELRYAIDQLLGDSPAKSLEAFALVAASRASRLSAEQLEALEQLLGVEGLEQRQRWMRALARLEQLLGGLAVVALYLEAAGLELLVSMEALEALEHEQLEAAALQHFQQLELWGVL